MLISDELPAPGATVERFIPGPDGRLEALVSAPKVPPRGICVVCHPHPLYGGAMSNKVVWTLASLAGKAGLINLRFNFRGVGKSEGTHDHAIGEVDDALAAIAWLRARAPGLPLLVAGFSFGGYVGIKAAGAAGARALVTVAPPFGRYVDAREPPAHPQCPWIALHSTDDDVVAFEDSRAALAAYTPAPELVRFEGAGHFFHGRLGDVEAAVLPFVQQHFAVA